MSTSIRPELSKHHKYHISKHRFYELKHFCLQYPEWKKRLTDMNFIDSGSIISVHGSTEFDDPTFGKASYILELQEKIQLVESIAKEADKDIKDYILKGVTEELSYTWLSTVMRIPCCRDVYYDRFRKFYYLLDKVRK